MEDGHGLQTTDAQVRKLMKEYRRSGKIGASGLKANMGRNTASKYIRAGKLPSELNKPHTWRTRLDPFSDHWPEVEQRLRDAPELEAKLLFEDLCGRHPDLYEEGQLRTFQRRVKQWRAEAGPDREVFFAQEHRPGEAIQTDFTWGSELEVTIGGQPFKHIFCHVVLPYSNWQWATICRTESLAALKRGLLAAVRLLGKVTTYHQTDNSTAATHNLAGGMRAFHEDYVEFMGELGMEPRTIAPGQKNQNGDVEALNGALKNRLKQHLLLRGSADFGSRESYEQWVGEVLTKANRGRTRKLGHELDAMKAVTVDHLREFTEREVRVTSHSTISVQKNIYSVPSRLIGEMVRVRIYDDRLEVYYGGKPQLTVERLTGWGGHRIDYRHIIWSLVRKPGAFRLFKYQEDLFPTLVFRKAYDAVCAGLDGRNADLEYLRILHLAASTLETEVEAALELLLDAGQGISLESVRALVDSRLHADPRQMDAFEVDLSSYDELLPTSLEAVS
jgi:hypothetical protein